MKHLLVTNDFPPKVGGIQSYLWELWRRLPPEDFTVLTTPYAGDAEFDAAQKYRVIRTRQKWLLPTRPLIDQVNKIADEIDADLVVLDPVLPLGLIGPKLNRPYVAIAHGAEYVIPARLPLVRSLISKVTKNAAGMIGSGDYVVDAVRKVLGDGSPSEAGARRPSPVPALDIPPGVDVERFRPLSDDDRAKTRERFGLPVDGRVIVGVSRLVPRKGFDRLVLAAARLKNTHPDVQVAIAGKGRDRDRLDKLIRQHDAPVRMLGRVDEADLPALYGCADVFCMPCHDRWFGLEQEGFGIVFAEAAAAGVPSVAGASGGSGEAVLDGETGFVVPAPVSVDGVTDAIKRLLDDAELRKELGKSGVDRAAEHFAYDKLAVTLADLLQQVKSS